MKLLEVRASSPLVGCRQWLLSPALEGQLLPTLRGAPPWTAGVNRATCGIGVIGSREHAAPQPRCSCGLHADHRTRISMGMVHAWNRHPWPDHIPERAVAGSVLIWGRVIVEAHAVRAEYARPLALWLNQRDAPQLMALAELSAAAYGIPYLPSDEFDRHAIEHGRPVDQDLVPDHDPDPLPAAAYEQYRNQPGRSLGERLEIISQVAKTHQIDVPPRGLLLLANSGGGEPDGDLFAACSMLAIAARHRRDLTVEDIWSAVAQWNARTDS